MFFWVDVAVGEAFIRALPLVPLRVLPVRSRLPLYLPGVPEDE